MTTIAQAIKTIETLSDSDVITRAIAEGYGRVDEETKIIDIATCRSWLIENAKYYNEPMEDVTYKALVEVIDGIAMDAAQRWGNAFNEISRSVTYEEVKRRLDKRGVQASEQEARMVMAEYV